MSTKPHIVHSLPALMDRATRSKAALSLEVAALDEAIRRIQNQWPPEGGWTKTAERLRARVLHHLERELERELGLEPPMDPNQQAMAIVKGVAEELRQAGSALEESAKRLHKRADGTGASRAHQASQRAMAAAEELVRS